MTSDFRAQLDRAYVAKVEKPLEAAVRRAALAADAALVRATPVDTGRARSNWIPSLNSPDYRIVDINQKPDLAAAVANMKPTDTIFITNSLPYIRRLNDGYSAQAPAGFVQAAVQSAVSAVNRR